eukprot:TRINITY_DN831_c0_g1_i3.p2 TRINITY_DN831_c0_g1~~TRINITY_DN831_c0_g1_i3.p2  ORF type:complete len:305 (+),score=137.15 TRINITY_DN831_c0_g1_i3:63-917(+)
MRAAAALMFCGAAAAAVPTEGPHKVQKKVYEVEAMDPTNKKVTVFYPTGDPEGKYPLLSYAHGAAGGGLFLLGYNKLFEQIASFGFIVAAPQSCFAGCKGTGWKQYFMEQLKMVDFAKNVSAAGKEEWASTLDLSTGVGVVGHSMGGQAVGYSSVEPYVSQYNLKAAMMHHPFTLLVKPEDIAIPIAVFTGTTDHLCPPKTAKKLYAGLTVKPRTYRNQVKMTHLEPVLESITQENPYLGYYTAAWFKVYLNGDKGEYYDHIYNQTDSESLCNYAGMDGCENVL